MEKSIQKISCACFCRLLAANKSKFLGVNHLFFQKEIDAQAAGVLLQEYVNYYSTVEGQKELTTIQPRTARPKIWGLEFSDYSMLYNYGEHEQLNCYYCDGFLLREEITYSDYNKEYNHSFITYKIA